MLPAQLEGKEKTEFRPTQTIFTFVVAFLVGLSIGIGASRAYFETKLDDAVKMQRMIYNSVVYDLMPWDKTGK